MDIGGSLTKIAYYSTLPLKKIVYDDQETVDDDAVYEVTEGARLHFIKFETKHIETTLDYIQKCLLGAETDMTVMDVKAEKVTWSNSTNAIKMKDSFLFGNLVLQRHYFQS